MFQSNRASVPLEATTADKDGDDYGNDNNDNDRK